MEMTFDEVKATQTAAFVIGLSKGRLQYLALIKLLYMLDREALNRWGLPVTTDRYVSMKMGPVTSRIYDLVKVKGEPIYPSYWSQYITRDGYDAVLLSDPGKSEMSPAEEDLAREIFANTRGKDGFTLADETHKHFPEWKDPGSSSSPIEISDILGALDTTESETANTEMLMSGQNALRSLTRG
jgi:hypothetical protein